MTKLTVHNAEIKTATVQIQTLTIGGKQVTLAVFRQLREEPLIAEDGTLNGIPWGTVNYHPDKCGDADSHWHIVWQHSTDLLRSLVYTSPRWNYFGTTTGNAFFAAHLRDLLEDRPTRFFGGKVPKNKYDDVLFKPTGGVQAIVRPLNHHVRDAWELLSNPDRYGKTWYQDQRLSLVEQLNQILGPTREQAAERLYRSFQNEIQDEVERRQRHTDIHKTLADLPQLFIAV